MISVERLGLIIGPDTDPSLGTNIQGPSVIRTPDWVENQLGTYLCYFADHKGDHIRLAYANEIAGPWTVHQGGCLSLSDSRFLTEAPDATAAEVDAIASQYDELYDGYECVDVHADLTAPHIASPDVRVNDDDQVIEMWFHGLEHLGWQVTRYATSTNAIDFVVDPPIFDGTYLRMFRIGDHDYGLAMPGKVLRCSGGPTEFDEGPTILPPTTRHMAVWPLDGELRVLFTTVGDAPERIKMVTVDTTAPWTEWTASQPVEVMRPECEWEGADVPVEPSIRSFWPDRANQLRDPDVFLDSDGTVYLFYAVAGECGIAAARLSVLSD